jgi:hypothetical protein
MTPTTGGTVTTDTNAIARREEAGALATEADREHAAGALAHILGSGDLGKLTNEQRVGHYLDVCQSLGLNPRTRPFDWIEFYDPQTKAKKLQLYPNRSCAEQLRRQHQISVRVMRREPVGSGTDDAMFVVEVEGTTPNGRKGTAIKYVPLTGQSQGGGTYRLKGNQLANAYMKAETGALRRLTFSMVGMASPPDVEDLARVRVVTVDGTGNVLDRPTQEQRYLAENPNAARAIGEPTFETVGGADDAPLAGTPDQRVTTDELTPPRREGARPTFKASPEDVNRWCGAWFSIVDDTPWDTSKARALFVGNHTDEWPEAKRTDSLRTMFARSTEAEAGEFLAKIRATVNVWKEGQAAEAAGEPELGSDVGLTPTQAAEEVVRQEGADRYQQLFGDDEDAPTRPAAEQPKAAPTSSSAKVRDAVILTGGTPIGPERLDEGSAYTRPELLDLYEQWGAVMQRLDSMWKPDDVKRLPDRKLREAVAGLIGQVDSIEAVLAMADDDEAGEGETPAEAF